MDIGELTFTVPLVAGAVGVWKLLPLLRKLSRQADAFLGTDDVPGVVERLEHIEGHLTAEGVCTHPYARPVPLQRRHLA